ncbi:DUF1775 domain-containing protein [Streptomyces cyanogenus]|uniref:YncI copper-binding domain-containing protein n=1 Tax=Streptomyces cyanogenus TaxID=80860 RepID=A0ABX7TT79_STRCY|nr:DUF1775 domain-containing protein [Streptomyces cyanogenus]QTD99934.1 hypothetical protein S1361_21535 [Streptomyces cyanogenus]
MLRAITKHRTARRVAVPAAVAATAVLLTAGPAAAHVEVKSEQAQALAENVKIEFDAESESATAGITKIRVALPKGIAPADVTYGEGPKGWKFTADKDGYTVGGPAVKVGENAEYSIVVKQLPDAEELAFKTLQTYGDGRTDRWIELDDNGENPAPVLKLKAAAPGAKPAHPSPSRTAPASPSASAQATTPTASPVSQEKGDDDGGLSTGAWVGIGIVAVVVAGGAVYLVRRRGGTSAG